MRVRNNPKSKTRLMNSNLVLVDPREKNNNWNDIFKNSNPIHLEIGSGKGKFIIDMAKKFPRINFIALETKATILCSLLDKLENTSIENIRLIWGNANYITEYFDKQEIEKIYLNFSDPWPKKRHEKRRLTSLSFIDKYLIILGKNNLIEQKTDNINLFEYSLKNFTKKNFSITEISLDLENSDLKNNNIKTEYEDKFTKKGNIIYYAKYER